MRIISWNVNGIRAAERKGFLDWLQEEQPDVLGVQETKANPEQLSEELLNPPGYEVFWNSAQRKGYSGVAIFCKEKPTSTAKGFGIERFDCEGRVMQTDFPGFSLLNIYFPNGQSNPERLKYKLDFYNATMDYCKKLVKKGKKLIVCGDYNTAHTKIDLARPKANEGTSGFLPIERAWLDSWVKAGFVDVFRKFHPEPERYSWWSFRTGARERNVGWRIDYHFVSENLLPAVTGADILDDVMGSDHCPISIDLDSSKL